MISALFLSYFSILRDPSTLPVDRELLNLARKQGRCTLSGRRAFAREKKKKKKREKKSRRKQTNKQKPTTEEKEDEERVILVLSFVTAPPLPPLPPLPAPLRFHRFLPDQELRSCRSPNTPSVMAERARVYILYFSREGRWATEDKKSNKQINKNCHFPLLGTKTVIFLF